MGDLHMLRFGLSSVALTALFSCVITAAEMREGIVFATPQGKELKLDVAMSGAGKMRPAIVFLHGGGWQQGKRDAYHDLMATFASQGYVTATLDYRLTDVAPWPAQIEDVQAGLRWLVQHANEVGIDPERIAIMGESAGGHLSLMAGMLPGETEEALRVRAVGNLYGPTDFRDVKNIANARSAVEHLVGGRLEDNNEALERASPVVHVDRGDPPVLTLHGTDDTLVPIVHARILHKRLEAAQIPNRMVPLERTGHSLGEHRERSLELLSEFFDQNLRGSGLPLVAHEDFDASADRWRLTDENAWKPVSQDGRSWFALTKKKSDYEPKVRSPHNIALLKNHVVSDFVFDVDMRSTNEPYGHQSLCLFFGYQDPSHFYYVHFGREADAHANSIFLVNDAPRVSIATDRTDGTDWSRGWHRGRIRRNVESGEILVFFDDMTNPVMVANDKTFTEGLIGIGSFDDTGEFDAVRLWGREK